MKRYGLTEEQWERIKAALPPERTGKRGRPQKDGRKMCNGLLWSAAVELLEKIEISGSNVLADRGYGAKTIRAYISEQWF